MTPSTRLLFGFFGRWTGLALVALGFAGLFNGTDCQAQGANGVEQRLGETLGQNVTFSGQIAGILNSRCGQCHVRAAKGQFNMATFNALMKAQGVVVPGKPEESSLYTLVAKGEMPPDNKLPATEISAIRGWIASGAKGDGDPNAHLGTMAGTSGRGQAGSAPAAQDPSAGYGSSGSGPGYGGSGSGPGSGPGYGAGGSGPGSGPDYGGSGSGPGSGPGYGGSGSGPGSGPGYGGSGSGPGSGPGYGGSGSGPGSGPGYGGSSSGPGYETDGYGDDMMNDAMDGMDGMDDMMDMGYGGSGGPGGFRSGGQSRGPSEAMQTYLSSLTSALDGVDLATLFQPPAGPVLSGPFLQREAEQAFQSGNHGLGLELMYGHMVAEFREAVVPLQTVKWSASLRQPVWGYRFGVSMDVRGSGEPTPIREGATPMGQGRGRGGQFAGDGDYGGEGFGPGGPGPGGFGPGGPGPGGFGRGGMNAEMDGGFGSGDDGLYGEGMAMDMGMDMEMPGMGMPGMGGGGRGGARSAPSRPQRNMLDPASAESFDKTLGLVAEVVAESFNERFRRGDFGTVLTNVGAPPPVIDPRQRGGNQPAASPSASSFVSDEVEQMLGSSAEPLPMWQPGIVSLGLGDSSELLTAARAAKLDFVFHFDVVLKETRTATQNISRCRLINVHTGKPVAMSRGMDSFEASKFASAGRMDERAYVKEQLGTLMSIIDRDIKVVDMPAGLTPQAVRGRISTLLAGDRSLRTLAEVRLYQIKGLITDEEVEAVFDIVGGVDGLTLLHGTQKERLETARRWAVEAQNTN